MLDHYKTVDHRPVPAQGMIDIHCHLLPGVDDGCKTVEESLRTIRGLMERGFVGSICTPHVWPDMMPDNSPPNIARWVRELQAVLDDEGLDYTLWPGGEMRLDPVTLAWVEENGLVSLAGSKYILVDLWMEEWPDFADAFFRRVLDQGLQPILAHPERLLQTDEQIPVVLDRLMAMGVLLQGNANSITGREGEKAARWVMKLLHQGKYHFLGLDQHGPQTMESRMEGLARMRIEAGVEAFDRYWQDRPREILTDALNAVHA